MNLVPYMKALNDADTRITLGQRVRAIRRRDDGRLEVDISAPGSTVSHTRIVDLVVGDHGVTPNHDLYDELSPLSLNRGEVDHGALLKGRPQEVRTNPQGTFQLFRIGDAVEGRNIHAAVYDALRLCKDL
jgi:hypothetical protein